MKAGHRETAEGIHQHILKGLWLTLPVLALFSGLPATSQDLGGSKAPTVTVATATVAEIVNRVAVSGTLVPHTEILIYPQVSGYEIQAIHVEVGDTVREGDVLGTMNNETLAARLAQADAELAGTKAAVRQAASQIVSAQAALLQAEAALERSEQLQLRGAVSTSSLDEAVAAEQTARSALAVATEGQAVAEAQLSQADALRNVARLTLEQARIKAPADGMISARNGQIGAIATSSGEPVFRMISGGIIEIAAEVIETELGQIRTGDVVALDIAGIGAADGVVRLIAPTVDPVTRLGIVRIETPANPGLRTGLFASGWIVTDVHDALTVPTSAVLAETGGTYVLVVLDRVIEKRSVAAGLIWEDRREILTGLMPGEVVVAKAGAFFGDGDQVTPVDPTQAAPKE